MSIRILRPRRFDFHVVKLEGVLVIDDLWAVYELHAANRDWAISDVINEVGADVDVTAISFEQLEPLRRAYQRLHGKLEAYIVRRSGNVCLSDAAWPLLEQWVQGRHSHDGGGTEFVASRYFDGLHPLFERAEIEAARDKNGCECLVTVDATRPHMTEAEYMAKAFALAETAEFHSIEELERTLASMAPVETKRYLVEDLIHMLDARCAIACMLAAKRVARRGARS